MIQRIQSIFLVLAAACFFGMFGLPLASSDVAGELFFADQVYDVTDDIILTILAILGGVAALLALLLFKKRRLQMRMGIMVIIAAIFVLLVAYLLVYNKRDILGDIEISEQFGIFLPILAIIFAVLANRFIKKDDKLVKSMDRLR